VLAPLEQELAKGPGSGYGVGNRDDMKPVPFLVFIGAVCLLGGVTVWQGVQGASRNRGISSLQAELERQRAATEDLGQRLGVAEAERARLESVQTGMVSNHNARLAEFQATSRLRDSAERELQSSKTQNERYQAALATATEKLQRQNEDIHRLNEELKRLAGERNTLIERHNRVAQEFNELTKKWNAQQKELARINAAVEVGKSTP